MLLTLLYMAVLAGLCVMRPLVGFFVLALLSHPGIIGVLQDSVGLKPWVVHPSVIVLGCLGLVRMDQQPQSDRFWPVVILALSGFYIVAVRLVMTPDIPATFFYVFFHGGLLAAFCLYNWTNRRFWNVVLAAMLTLLALSAAAYWLGNAIPFFARFDGLRNASEQYLFGGELARIGGGVRGTGVFLNQNCWAQVTGVGVVIGLAMVLLTRGFSRLCGILLLSVSVLGVLGSMGRATILGTIAATLFLLLGRFATRSGNSRLTMLVVTAAAGLFLVFWAQGRTNYDETFELGSDEGVDYRIDQLRGVAQRFGDYWLMGSQSADQDIKVDDPHDIVMGYIYYFGLFPALAAILAIVGGLRVTIRWIEVGGERLGYELGLPANLSWAGHVVVPVFMFIMVAGLGNGIAGGTPYQELFLMYLYFCARRWTMHCPENAAVSEVSKATRPERGNALPTNAARSRTVSPPAAISGTARRNRTGRPSSAPLPK